MCAACLEFIKEKLTVNELRSALREMTVDDPGHLKQVTSIIDRSKDPAEIKKNLQKLIDE
jgi:hypothetical protein